MRQEWVPDAAFENKMVTKQAPGNQNKAAGKPPLLRGYKINRYPNSLDFPVEVTLSTSPSVGAFSFNLLRLVDF